MVHRKVLDVAEANPDASLDAIAKEVSGASATFVERVLEEYGDPAANGSQTRKPDGIAGDGGSSAPVDGPTAKTSGPRDGTNDAHEGPNDGVAVDDGTNPASESTETETTAQSATVESTAGETDETPKDEAGQVTDPSELTEKQYETLLAVHERPGATQEEIGAELNVSRATVSKRLNDVPGFEWATRQQFVDQLFETRGSSETAVAGQKQGIDSGTLTALAERVDAIEEKLDARSSVESSEAADPDLVHKIVHACMEAEYISREEELEILRSVLPSGHAVNSREDSDW